MTDLRAAAQQVLKALKGYRRELGDQQPCDAEQALEAALAEPVQEPQGCDHCNHPLYAATKCRVCGRVTKAVQEPVAWIHTDPDRPRVKFLEWRENEPGYRGDWIKTPLYTAPPQRKPLTEAEIDEVWNSLIATPDFSRVKIARAIERAHGIGVQP